MHAKKLLAHKFDPFPAMTLSEFCLFAPAILHTITRSTRRAGIKKPAVRRVGFWLSGFYPGPLLFLTDVLQL